MSSLDYSLTIFTYCGLWRPQTWLSGWKYHLYNTYTIFTVVLIVSMTLLELITLAMSFDNINNIADRCTMMFAMLTVCGKMTIILVHRTRILQLLQILESGSRRAQNPDEEEAKQKITRKIRFRTKFYIWIMMIALSVMLSMTLIICIPQRTLWINAWKPFEITTNTQYIFMFTYEIVTHYTAAIVTMGYDTFVPGIILQVSVQLNLLQYRIYMRLKKMESELAENSKCDVDTEEHVEKAIIANWIRHHLLIYQFAAESNEIFWPLIFAQYGSSMILLCVNIYALAQVPLFSPPFLSTLVYTSVLFIQIFLLCLAGTEVMDHSSFFSRSIYDTQWYVLNQNSKRSIHLMMTRSLKSIQFNSTSIIEASLQSFLRLIKISYSVYNCLQRLSYK